MKKFKNREDASKRRTPWDDAKSITPLEKYIRNYYHREYDSKHMEISQTNDHLIFNDIKIDKCRYCNSNNVIKKGKLKSNIQRYYCKNCKKYFNPTTNTIFENHKISLKQWIDFLQLVFDYGSMQIIAKVNRNSINTIRYWLYETFQILKTNQGEVILSGKVYLDETYYTISASDITYKDGKKLSGISRNKYCIAIAYDGTNVIVKVIGKGKPTKEKIYEAFKNNIENGSTLIHDGEKAHKTLVEELNLISKTYKTDETKKLSDEKNPLNPINKQCYLLKKFLESHSGFDRTFIQDYCNLFTFISSGKGKHKKLEKTEELLKLSLTTKITIKYRNVFQDGDSK